MHRIRAIALDLTGNAENWLNAYTDGEHTELVGIITLDDDSPVNIADLPTLDNWDVLLVFEDGLRDQVDRLLSKLSISRDRVIFPMDMHDRNNVIASYIFGGPIRKLLRYYSYRPEGYKYALGSAEGLTYINAASDDIILPTMIFEGKNWAKEEMTQFYDLAAKHFSFRDEQVLFCDIGANIGTTCIYFKKYLDKDVKILAFEPSESNHRLLRANALLNGLEIEDHMFVKKGVSDTSSTAQFNYKPGNPGGSSVVSGEGTGSETIELVTLDDHFEVNGIDPETVKYIWIDVEGFEARFLAGARNVLSRINVPILMEFIPEFYEKKEGEFELLMEELNRNFRSFICIQETDKGIMPIEDLRKEQLNMDIQWDLFLLK